MTTGAEKVITGGIRQPQKHVIIDLGDKDQFMVDKQIAGLTDADSAGHNNVGEGYGIDIATFCVVIFALIKACSISPTR